MTDRLHRYWIPALLVLTAYRLISGFIAPLPFQVDEAQYVGWSHWLDAGYYSKPPMIAWMVRLGSEISAFLGFTSIEGSARAMQAVAILIATVAVHGTATSLFGNRSIRNVSALIFATMPLAGFYGLYATTDAWLLMFWALALWAFVGALQSTDRTISMWVLCGLFCGLGLLSKYSMGAFLISALVVLISEKRLFKRGPWIAALTAFIVFAPNLNWNMVHQFPTFSHHLEISQIARQSDPQEVSLLDHAQSLGEFLGAQFFVFGPLLFGALIFWIIKFRDRFFARESDQRAAFFLLSYIWPLLLLALIQAASSRAHANWAAPAYVAASILVTAICFRFGKVGGAVLAISLFFGLTVSLALIHVPKHLFHAASHQEPTIRGLEKLRGWKGAALWAKNAATELQAIPIADNRQLLAAISAYGPPQVATPYAWNPSHARDNHYTWFLSADQQHFAAGQKFLLLLVRPENSAHAQEMPFLSSKFETIQPMQGLDKARLPVGADNEVVRAYLVSGLKQ